jgi:hypothetical protein
VGEPANTLLGFATFVFLSVECGITAANGHTTDAEIVGVFLIPVTAWVLATLFKHHRRD